MFESFKGQGELLFAGALLAFIGWRYYQGQRIKNALPGYFRRGAIIVDVRSPEEFHQSHVEGSLNIPLQDISTSTNRLDKKKPILVCCASGGRSSAAASILRRQGFEAVNAGSWVNLMGFTSKS